MDSERIAKILIKIGQKSSVILCPQLKYILFPHLQSVLNKEGIQAELNWINYSEYNLYQDFDYLMRKNPDKLNVFERLFCD